MNQSNGLAKLFGLAGLIPPILCLGAVIFGKDYGLAALALNIAFGYAMLIYSFLGGLWWGIASSQPPQNPAPRWLWVAAITPSLIAFALYVLQFLGADVGALMIALGIAIALSPLVDRAINSITPPWWIALRITLSLGLGGLTIVLGVVG